MMPALPRAWGEIPGSAMIRCQPEDFLVSEQLGFELSGEGEHRLLYLQKRQLNTQELLQRVASLCSVQPHNIGFCGLKDRNAVTRQWVSVGVAGTKEPDWQLLEAQGDVQVVAVERHARKLRRGVHRSNRFTLVLRDLAGDADALERRLRTLREFGVPNYFGEQRFGRSGSTLEQARRWMRSGRRVSRDKRGLYFSALRAHAFNQFLALRVENGEWSSIVPGDVCMLHGTRSFFNCDEVTDDIRLRAVAGDVHPGLPLWGRGLAATACYRERLAALPDDCREVCDFLEASSLELAWRPARLLPEDFCWQYCDDKTLRLDFSLGAGCYATTLLAEFVRYKEGSVESGNSGKQD
jgi:tRNA pseudouridine13 synthase